jgi:hypothetical protein
MTRVLDGYLMGRASGGRGLIYNRISYSNLVKILVLDGYLPDRRAAP